MQATVTTVVTPCKMIVFFEQWNLTLNCVLSGRRIMEIPWLPKLWLYLAMSDSHSPVSVHFLRWHISAIFDRLLMAEVHN